MALLRSPRNWLLEERLREGVTLRVHSQRVGATAAEKIDEAEKVGAAENGREAERVRESDKIRELEAKLQAANDLIFELFAALEEARRPSGLQLLARRGRAWVTERGVLYLLSQAPMVAFLTGYLWRLTTFLTSSAVSFAVAGMALPAVWQWRPVPQLRRWAVWALVPVAVYDVARIPNFYLVGNAYWERWFDFGHQLLGLPPASFKALAVGMGVHFLQGYVLGLGFYILFRYYTFLNAFSYLFVFLSTVYLTQFALFTGLEVAPLSLYLVGWDHFWMAVAAWATPRLWGRVRPALVPAVVAVLASPFAFAFAQGL